MEPPQQQEPSQITVTVFSARKLLSKKRGDVPHASVVFGVGKDYFMTETVESSSPEWNQEAQINVAGRLHGSVKFKVRDKDHTLGVVTIAVSEIGSQRGERWYALQPHRKSQEVHGELLISCWVSEHRSISSEKGSPLSSHASSNEDLVHLGKAKVKEMFSFHRRTPSGSRSRPDRHSMHDDSLPTPDKERRTLSQHFSGSDNEIHSKRSLRRFYQSDSTIHSGATSPERISSMEADFKKLGGSHSVGEEGAEEEPSLVPEVSGISPKEGSMEGSEKVMLRGSNLGTSKLDVKRVIIADVDCTETLEYFSPAKLVVTTFPRAIPGSGPVTIETETGGVGVSSITYTFVGPESVRGSSVEAIGSYFKKRSKPSETEELQTEVKALKQQVRDLKDDNAHLREDNILLRAYIDKILLSVINTTPEILEIPTATRLNNENFIQ